MDLTVAVKVRLRNDRLVKIGAFLLGLGARWMRVEHIASLGNRLVRLLRVEGSIGGGPWVPMTPALCVVLADGAMTIGSDA